MQATRLRVRKNKIPQARPSIIVTIGLKTCHVHANSNVEIIKDGMKVVLSRSRARKTARKKASDRMGNRITSMAIKDVPGMVMRWSRKKAASADGVGSQKRAGETARKVMIPVISPRWILATARCRGRLPETCCRRAFFAGRKKNRMTNNWIVQNRDSLNGEYSSRFLRRPNLWLRTRWLSNNGNSNMKQPVVTARNIAA